MKKVQSDINSIPDTISEIEYKNVRDNKSIYEDWYVGLVGFCSTFGAKYFGGYARGFKEDGVTLRDIPNESIRNLKKQSTNLKDVIFRNCDFREININDLNKALIYCDIPYRDTTKYSTSSFPYDEFYNWCRKMSKNNIVLISEYSLPDDFKCVWQKEHKTSLGSGVNKEGHQKRIEKLYICEYKN